MHVLRQQEYRFTALGGGNDIGGSYYALQLGDSVIMLDAGIKYKTVLEERTPNVTPLYSVCGLDGLWELDSLAISHTHLVHAGFPRSSVSPKY